MDVVDLGLQALLLPQFRLHANNEFYVQGKIKVGDVTVVIKHH